LFAKIPSFKEIKHKERMILSLVDLFCELNIVHPFREGNGRVLRFFFEELAFTLGYEISWPKISNEDWVSANLAGVNLDLVPLKNIFKQAIS
jgi:cell filamentation protein